jgi:imidazolonepropionase-like amidohydrolase
MKKNIVFVLLLLIVVFLAGQTQSAKILIINATIVPVIGANIERGQLLIENGKIAALGDKLENTAGAQVLDASGMFVYPGLIDAFSRYGLAEISAISSTVDVQELGKENPELRTAWAINPQSVHFGTGRCNGTTTALVAPAGKVFPGLAALVKMDGWTFPEMALQEVAASLINFPISPRSRGEGGSSKAGESKLDVTGKLVEKIKEFLAEARFYLMRKEAAARNRSLTMPEVDPKFEALAPVLAGQLPVIITVEKAKDIELAIKFVREEKLKAIFRGCSQGFKVAEKIKAAGIPVIIDSLYQDPLEPEDGYDAPYRNVAELVKAGVAVCFSSGDDPTSGKDLTYYAARAVAFGLEHQEAIKALTIGAARILGIADRLGSLEVGKDADLFICSGDPLDIRSQVKNIFINGKPVDMNNWWEQQYSKWKSRPGQK